jgi:cysteinyl-tRNA synthetase
MIINGEENGHLNCQEARDHFIEAMEDDLGTAQAIAILCNPASGGAALLRELGGVLGLTFHTDEHLRTTEPLVELLINVRETLRTKQEYVLGDKIRDDLADMGITLEDGEEGTTWRFTPQTIKNDSVENDAANDSSLDTIKF